LPPPPPPRKSRPLGRDHGDLTLLDLERHSAVFRSAARARTAAGWLDLPMAMGTLDCGLRRRGLDRLGRHARYGTNPETLRRATRSSAATRLQ
jgi:hypothetical protein